MQEERRRPRQSFTRALKRIAGRIDSHDCFEITYFNPILYKQHRSVVRVAALWAFGSWVRGAPDCGDLDLMADISLVDGTMPVESAIRRALVNRARDVRLYIGMMLVPHWSGRGPNGIWHIRRGEKHSMNAY
ncbi:MAG: hypothetical protein ABIL58_11185 [Pseudomonadota bacterium]